MSSGFFWGPFLAGSAAGLLFAVGAAALVGTAPAVTQVLFSCAALVAAALALIIAGMRRGSGSEHKRRALEESLMHEHALFQALLDNAPDGVYFKDAESRFTRINRTVARHFGLSDPAEAIGQTDASFFRDEFFQQTRADELAVMRTGRPLLNKEEREVWPDGHETWAATSTIPLLDAAGQVVGILGITRDITAQKMAELSVRQAEGKYRSIFENAVEGIYQTSVDGRFLTANPMLARIYGYATPQELIAAASTRPNHLYVEAGRRAEFIRLMQERRTLNGFESQVRRPDGSLVWISENARAVLDVAGHVVGYEGWVVDVTERKRAEEALARERALLRGLLDSIPDHIFYKSRDGTYLGCNSAFERYAGRPEEELIGRTALDLFPRRVGDAYGEIDRQVLDEGQPYRSEEWIEYPDGRRVLVEVVKTPFLGPDGKIQGLIGISRDITERKRLEEQLRQGQKMEAIGQLAGGIAHDFNNLLTAILGNVSLLLGNLSANEPGEILLRETELAAVRAAELTRQLLGFSRQSVLRLEPTDLNASTEEVAGMLRRTIDPRIRLDVRGHRGLWPVQADPSQMHQVLMNLCLNARDAMPGGGLLRLETANVLLGEDVAQGRPEARVGEFVRLRVTDTGCGIPADVRPRIFDPFFTTKGPGKGTGLGLAMVFGIVQQHQGWIDCHSEVGYGTCFDVYLPRSSTAGLPAPASGAVPAAGGCETVLLVDDETIVRNLARAILERHGYQVLLAADGWEALAVYRRERSRVGLVVLDLTMPHLSGRDTLHELLRIDPRVRVLFCSGYSVEQVTESERHGVLGFVNKPYRPHELAAAVRAALDQPRAIDALSGTPGVEA